MHLNAATTPTATNIYEIARTGWENELNLRYDVFHVHCFVSIAWICSNTFFPFSNIVLKVILLSLDVESIRVHVGDRFLHTIDWLPIGCLPQRHKSSESQQKHVSRLLNVHLCVAHTVHVLRNSDSLCRWRELYAQNECSIIALNTHDGVGGITGILHVIASV